MQQILYLKIQMRSAAHCANAETKSSFRPLCPRVIIQDASPRHCLIPCRAELSMTGIQTMLIKGPSPSQQLECVAPRNGPLPPDDISWSSGLSGPETASSSHTNQPLYYPINLHIPIAITLTASLTMVLLEHLPLIGLALGFAHHHSGRASHSHSTLPNHRHVHQLSADMSPFDRAPKLIAARAEEESHETTIQVPQHQLQTILNRIKSLEEEIFNMMLSKADSSVETKSEPLTTSKPETLVVTTREPTAAPASKSIA